MPAEFEKIREGIKRSNPKMDEGNSYAIAVAVYQRKYGVNPFTGKPAGENKATKYRKENKKEDKK